ERRSEVRGEIASVEERLEDARDRKTDAAESVRDVEASIESIDGKREDVDQRMGEIEADIAAKDDEIESVRADIEAVEEELADSRIPELSAEAEEVQDEIDELERRVDGVDGSLNELQLEKGYAEDAVEDLHDAIEEAQNRKAEGEARIEEIEGKIEEKEETLDEKRAAVEELEEELADLKEEREELRAELREAQAERDETREAAARVENRIESLEAATERLEAEIDELAEAVEDYDPEEIPDHEEVRTKIDRLELEMERLEPVNMLAIDEYDAVEEELADLGERKDTLVEERDGIRERIESYERQKKETFMEAFDGIDEYFRDIFSRLSNGSGELHLENPEDPFEAGLTMKAKPGDKPVQRLDAMSGGEKSLTALAFIFAIQRYNPAPFYALDEVDAFLDAANAERVGEMLDELADRAQFVVVSHRSAMLERSERAIGVTMQDDNVSAVTGIAMAADGGQPEEAP
ncbi:MAG TPA: AAA family ATPase, partial [Halobacteriales archaeon]|nr:AAA family ATPase [Halobacteriales archaeon]